MPARPLTLAGRRLFGPCLALLLALAACGAPEAPRPQEYVIVGRPPAGPTDPPVFTVVALGRGTETSVAAVREVGGQYYLPTMSRMPSFNRKVVEGYFAPATLDGLRPTDSVFVVTRMVRDTTAAAVGR